MDTAIKLLDTLIWPATVLVGLFYFRRILADLVDVVSLRMKAAKGLSAKVGGVSVSMDFAEQLDSKVRKIAEEPDPQKRLELAKQTSLLSEVVRHTDPEDIKLLEKFYVQRDPHLFPISFWHIAESERESFQKLEKLGVFRSYPCYDGDFDATLTPLGQALLRDLGMSKHPETEAA